MSFYFKTKLQGRIINEFTFLPSILLKSHKANLASEVHTSFSYEIASSIDDTGLWLLLKYRMVSVWLDKAAGRNNANKISLNFVEL